LGSRTAPRWREYGASEALGHQCAEPRDLKKTKSQAEGKASLNES